MKNIRFFIYFMLIFLVATGLFCAQEKSIPNLFIEADVANLREAIEKIEFVRLVENMDLAQISLKIRKHDFDSIYYLEFKGFGDFEGIDDDYVIKIKSEEDEIQSIIKNIEIALLKYMSKTKLKNNFKIHFDKNMKANKKQEDEWDYWVFQVGGSINLTGEQTRDTQTFSGFVYADRITDEVRLDINLSASYESQNYELIDSTITSVYENYSHTSSLVKSLGDHFAYGFHFGTTQSSYDNLDLYAYITPAVEYNLFPYWKSNHYILRAYYRAGYVYNNYIEETVYNKWEDHLAKQWLSLAFSANENWGTILASISGSNYFHDLTLYRLTTNNSIDFKLFGGLALSLGFDFSLISSQLSLPLSEASEEEILLGEILLETSFDYSLTFGFTYTFGSDKAHVVNPRFGY
ncbi:MAG: hypothetical protein ABIA04_16415 [Pseudomonadota bacterium]